MTPRPPDEERPELRTISGHLLGDVTSALIKAVRAGDEQAAMFWCLEMERYSAHTWRRLAILASEDCAADPLVAVTVSALWGSWERLKAAARKGQVVEQDLMAHAVIVLCRSRKGREPDLLKCLVQERRKAGWKLQVPPEAHDIHTEVGRRRGATVRDWWESTAKLGGAGRYQRYQDAKVAGRPVNADGEVV